MAPHIDNAAILALTEAGKSSRDIEAISGGTIDHATVCRRLKHLTPRKSTEIFKSRKADVFAEMQRKIMMSCDNRTLKAGGKDLQARITSVGILFDKEQIARGHSSEGKPLVIIVDRSQHVIVDNPVDNPCIDILSTNMVNKIK